MQNYIIFFQKCNCVFRKDVDNNIKGSAVILMVNNY